MRKLGREGLIVEALARVRNLDFSRSASLNAEKLDFEVLRVWQRFPAKVGKGGFDSGGLRAR